MPTGFPSSGNFNRGGAQNGSGVGVGGGAPDIDYDQVNALLQHFGGFQVPQDQQPQGMFENMPWLNKRSPGLATGLDNALIALSNMGPTGPTAGDNISNVARGLQSIGPTRRAQQLAPTMTALQMAGEVAKLQQASANIGREGAMAEYYGGRNETASSIAQSRMNVALQKQQMLAGKEGVILKDGTVGLPDVDDATGKVTYVPHPEIDAKEFQKQQRKSKIAGIMGNSFEGLVTQGMLGDDPDSYKGGAQQYWKDANDILLKHRTAAAGVGAASRSDEGELTRWNKNQQDQFKNIFSGPGTAGIREKRIDQRAQDIFMERNQKGGPGVTLDKARKDAQWEEQQHQGKLQQAWSEFSLMGPDEQQRRGGIIGHLGAQGYDPASDSFGMRPSTPNPTPGVAQTPPTLSLGGKDYDLDAQGIPRVRTAPKP